MPNSVEDSPETTQKPPEEEEPTKPSATPEKKKKKTKKPRQAKTSHPPYFQMISEALEALNEKTGSSPYAIAKHMEENHKDHLPDNFRKILTLQLKNSVAKGKLMKIKASYKLAGSGKSATVKPAKETEVKTRAAKKKKVTPAKKKPKTIKSPAKKKTRKVSAK